MRIGTWSALLAAGLLAATHATAQTASWMNRSLPPERRAALLIAAMSEDEKFQQMVGAPGVVPELPRCYGGRHVPGLPRLRFRRSGSPTDPWGLARTIACRCLRPARSRCRRAIR